MNRILGHKDSDGFAASGVVYKYLKEQGVPRNQITLHPINYGMPIPEEINYEKDTVYLVDFSMQPDEVMVDFASKLGDRLIWIDHHSTSVDMEDKYLSLQKVPGVRQVDWEAGVPISGCELVWKYFYAGKEMPLVLQIVGDWDVWRWPDLPLHEQEAVKNLQYLLDNNETDPSSHEGRDFWVRALEGPVAVVDPAGMREGAILRKFQAKKWHDLVKTQGFEANFCGLKAIMVNQKGNSEMFNGFFNPEKHDVMVTFQDVKGLCMTVSMYGKDCEVHLGDLAAKVGNAGDRPSGGGHHGAAGFQCSWEYFRTLYDVLPSTDS